MQTFGSGNAGTGQEKHVGGVSHRSFSNHPCILLVEGYTAHRSAMVMFLTRLGYRVVMMNNGIDAIEWMFTDEPDTFKLILLDWHLRDVPSVEVCQRIRRLPHCRDLPIVAMAEEEQRDITSAAWEAGINGTMNKFAHPRDMRAMMQQWVGKVKKQRR